MTKQTSREIDRIFRFGERLAENPQTLLLSIPVYFAGWIVSKIRRHREGQAAAFGYSGIAFKNLYKHYWKNKFLLRIAYFLFRNSARLATGEGRPTVLLKCGQTALEFGEEKKAEENFREGIEDAKKRRDEAQEAYVLAHLGELYLRQRKFSKANESLSESIKKLEKAILKDPEAVYFHIWLSYAELAMAGYSHTVGDQNKTERWIKRAEERVNKHDLKTRKLDVEKAKKKLGMVAFVSFWVVVRFLYASG